MIKITDLNLSYPDGKKVLNSINMHIKKGECLLLCGESGCGKSSLIKAMNGIATAYDNCNLTGDIIIDNTQIQNMKLYEISQIISSVFQNPKTHFFNVDTTTELLFQLENCGVSKKEMDLRLTEMLQLFPIEHLLNRNIFQLSGGEKQILSIAASYIAKTSVIVLDEPSSNLDSIYTKVMTEMLQKLKAEGVTIIIAEHRLNYLMEIADTVVYLKNGEVTQNFSQAEFLQIEKNKLAEMGLRSLKEDKLLIQKEITSDGDFKIERLEYSFKGLKNYVNLENVNLSYGKIYGIIGKNGVGKSTFVKSLIGVNRKSKESIFCEKTKLTKKARLKKSGLVMQDVNHQLFSDCVLEEISLGVKDTDQKQVESVLKHLGIWENKDDHPMCLSGGQKQRVAIASVINANDQIICFDEPTSGMDYRNMCKISELIKSCIDDKKIIFIISHDIEFLNQTADAIINIEQYCKCDK